MLVALAACKERIANHSWKNKIFEKTQKRVHHIVCDVPSFGFKIKEKLFPFHLGEVPSRFELLYAVLRTAA